MGTNPPSPHEGSKASEAHDRGLVANAEDDNMQQAANVATTNERKVRSDRFQGIGAVAYFGQRP
ncbi:hypothetical protein AMC85_CH04033 [Rhizobium phaseoli]|nr:hypothetical protein AMC88_CH04036 [Rhizobium phaseoli]ANL61355.1 hypothetical protein AMC85_CH04033 [Rhizobium phaseoli]